MKKSKIKKILKNGGVFAILLFFTYFTVFKQTSIQGMTDALESVKLRYIFLGLAAMVIYASCEGKSIGMALEMLGYKMSYRRTLKYAMTGFFFSAITPSSTGGQPMQVVYMYKDGVKISHATLALLFQLLSYEIVMVIYSLIGFFSQTDLLHDAMGNIKYVLLIGIGANVLVVLLILLSMFSRTAIHFYTRIADKVAGWISGANADVVKEKVESVAQDYSEGAQYFMQNRTLFIKTLFVSAVQILAMFSVPYIVYKSFGLSGYSAFQIISIQAVLYNSINFLPIPGAVGSSEGMFYILFRKIFTSRFIGSAMLLSRCLSFYLCVLICGLAVIVFTRKFMRNDEMGAVKKDDLINHK
jgi:uncharacterized protein (TIRG00374 family)